MCRRFKFLFPCGNEIDFLKRRPKQPHCWNPSQNHCFLEKLSCSLIAQFVQTCIFYSGIANNFPKVSPLVCFRRAIVGSFLQFGYVHKLVVLQYIMCLWGIDFTNLVALIGVFLLYELQDCKTVYL